MRLTVVGCAGSVAGPGLPASCYVLEADAGGRTWRLLLDLGSGAIGPLQAVVYPATLDGILISHGHPDHCADLASLSVLLRYGPSAGDGHAPIPLWGPEGIDERLRQVEGSADDSGLAPFAWSALEPGVTRTLGPFTVTAARAWHPVPALAYRIEGPSESGGVAMVVFTGDTDLTDEVVEAATGADLLLAEAGWADRAVNPEGIHLTGTQAGELAQRAGVHLLVVTHIPPWASVLGTLDQARAAHADATLARPGRVFDV